MNDSKSLCMLLDSARDSGACDARDLPIRFRATLARLDTLGIPAVFVGQVAYGRYAAAQFCEQIDVLLAMEASSTRWDWTLAALAAADSTASSVGSTVKLVVHSSRGPEETALIVQTQRVPWLGCSAPLATAEHLLVRFLLEGTGVGSALAVQLAMAHPVNPLMASQIGAMLAVPDRAIEATLQRAVRDKASHWRADHRREESTKS